MHLKIHFGDKPLFLCDEIDSIIESFVHHDDAVFITELDPHAVKSMIHEMQRDKIHAGVFFHRDLKELKKAFWKKFTVIQAAGGLVVNEENKLLMIFRRGKWDLPKGKLDKGETLEECAIREVQEETGLNDVQLQWPITVTYHTYREGTKFVLKESYWYSMLATSAEKLTPQTEEDILEIKWVGQREIECCMENTFPSIKDVYQLYALKLQP